MEDMTMLETSQGLFEDISFVIISSGLPESQVAQIENDICAARGTIIPFDAVLGHIKPESLEEVDYIVSETSDFRDYYKALDLMKHVVKSKWIAASLKSGKAKNPRTYSPDPALFMHDVVICCGDIPSGDQEAIEGGVLAMGGQVAPQLSKLVTHLIALDIGEERCQTAIAHRLKATIVLPHWFDDCLRVGRRISERPYQLPDPEILAFESGAIPNPPTSQHIQHATTSDPFAESVPQSLTTLSEAPRAARVFHNKKVMLSGELEISAKLRGVLTSMICAGGGTVIDKIDDADIYVCKYREGLDYVTASQGGKDVGNLGWLYYLITHNHWTNPMRRMLHYPRPRGGIPGFQNYKISISSYTGEARVYLVNLIKASGAEFTKQFQRGENTHLITAHKNSEKCDAAANWGINIVNHLWLEDSYAKCKEMPLTESRYLYFPSRTNLGEILGQTEIDRVATEKMFFSKAHGPKRGNKTAPQTKDIPASGIFGAMHSEHAAASSPVVDKAKCTKPIGAAQTPSATRLLYGKENLTPGSRGAKDKALSRIHDAAPDIALYEKEKKRAGGVTHGGRRRAADESTEDAMTKAHETTANKRSINEFEHDDDTEDDTKDVLLKNKKAKKEKLAPIKFRMLVSMDKRWDNNDEKASKDKARLRELGLFVTDDFKKVDLVCAPKPVRTKKFVAALACAPTLVSTSYLDYALKNNKLPPTDKHILNASDFEKTYDFKFAEALGRAEQNKHRLLKDWTIFCTEQVGGGFDTYKDIIEANGGKCFLWKGRTTTVTASKRKLDAVDMEVTQNQEEDEGDVLYLISRPDKKEFSNWAKFRELAEKHDMVPRIVSTEWLLFVAMAQYVHWDPVWELSEADLKAAK